MQQAVASSQCTLPSTSAIFAASFNCRHLIKNKIKILYQSIYESIQQLRTLNSSTAKEKSQSSEKSLLITIDSSDISSRIEELLKKLIDEYSRLKVSGQNSNSKLILDSLLEPFIFSKESTKLANTFYENRFGFSQSELLLSSFSNQQLKLNGKAKRNSLLSFSLIDRSNTNNLAIYGHMQQTRGFRTKKIQEKKEGAFTKRFEKLFKPEEDELSKTINKLLATPIYSNPKKGGSLFTSTDAKTEQAAQQSKAKSLLDVNEFDTKVKQAFVEGFLYKETKDEKKKSLRTLLRLVLFGIIVFILINSISITTVSPGNGRNGSAGGGINIRALTGVTNFEINPEQVNVKFDDVKGLPEAKKELIEIVNFLKDPEKYTRLGARLPKGVMLVGPPGCGKTLLAKSVAGEAGVPFFQASGSDFDEMFVGTGSKRVRQLFQAARAKAPCVIFIDEIG
jgi:hypothetical protein